MNVLSLFDGSSCGQLALRRANIKYDNYYASEIDKYAIVITQKNFPDTIQMGDVTKIKGINLPKIDLLIGGSPCQSFSNSGNGSGFSGKSGLFFEYLRLLKELKPKYFLLENVVMKKEWCNKISYYLNVDPIKINSELLSCQSRPRLYWTNIPGLKQPIDKEINLKDCLEENIEEKYYLSNKALNRFARMIPSKKYLTKDDVKVHTLVANYNKLYPRSDYIKDIKGIRKFTPLECERFQTVPDNYTEGVSDTRRYHMLGNGWTVDIIAHIFSNIPTEKEKEKELNFL